MVYFLYGLFFISCIILVGAVLLQPGKTDAGALFTSNIASSALSPRGTTTVLSKITIAAAGLFMLSALFLSMPALTGNVSVLSSNPDAPAESTTSNDNTAPPDANANTAAPADANSNLSDTNANTAPEPANTAANSAPANSVANTATR